MALNCGCILLCLFKSSPNEDSFELGFAWKLNNNFIKNIGSLVPDEETGIEITPKHVMQSARELLGIDQHEKTRPFGLDIETNIDIFSV